MKPVYRCMDCTAIYPPDLRKKWGTTQETDGYGPVLRCTQLVEAANGADEVCGGALLATEVANDTPVPELHPITSERSAVARSVRHHQEG